MLWVLMVLIVGDSRAQAINPYKGQLELPVDLYTEDGTLLRQGETFDLEMRRENSQHLLVFLKHGKTVARVNERPATEQEANGALKPVVGTIYLQEGQPSEKVSRSTTWFDFGRVWKAALRIYKSRDPGSKAVYFIIHERVGSEECSRKAFTLTTENHLKDDLRQK